MVKKSKSLTKLDKVLSADVLQKAKIKAADMLCKIRLSDKSKQEGKTHKDK